MVSQAQHNGLNPEQFDLLLKKQIVKEGIFIQIYGNEFDPTFMCLCRDRLEKLGVPKYNIHQGDALISECLKLSSFTPQYNYERIKQLHEKGNRVSLW